MIIGTDNSGHEIINDIIYDISIYDCEIEANNYEWLRPSLCSIGEYKKPYMETSGFFCNLHHFTKIYVTTFA